jgi:Raf kinase inhibitor-like YbhB/YbcL family protein
MRFLIALLSLLYVTAGYTAASVNAPVKPADFTLTSPSIANKHRIPTMFTCDGENLSPQLNWENPPQGTASYAIEFYSPDSLAGVYYNWVVYNISPSVTVLEENASKSLPGDAQTANNTAGDNIYRGPCPPDAGLHHYVFEIFALDSMIDLSGLTDMDEITSIIDRHKIKSATITVLFAH